MFIGRVVGTLWGTQKTGNTEGLKFLIIQPLNLKKAPNTDTIVAADTLGAGEGELVLVAYGRAARLAIGNESASIEAAVTAIIDGYDVDPALYAGDLDSSAHHFRKKSN